MLFSFLPSSKGKVLKKRKRPQPTPFPDAISPTHSPSREPRPFRSAPNPTPQTQTSKKKRTRITIIAKILEARKKRMEEGHRAYAARDAAISTGGGSKRGGSTLVKNRHLDGGAERGKGRGAQQEENAFVIPEIGHVSTFTDLAMPADEVMGLENQDQGDERETEQRSVDSDGGSSMSSVRFVPSGEWVSGWSGVSGGGGLGLGQGRVYTGAYEVAYSGDCGSDFGSNGG